VLGEQWSPNVKVASAVTKFAFDSNWQRLYKVNKIAVQRAIGDPTEWSNCKRSKMQNAAINLNARAYQMAVVRSTCGEICGGAGCASGYLEVSISTWKLLNAHARSRNNS
jgi:hypothetical protein